MEIDDIRAPQLKEPLVQLLCQLGQSAFEGVVLPGVDGDIILLHLKIADIPQSHPDHFALQFQEQGPLLHLQPLGGPVQDVHQFFFPDRFH